MPLLAACSLSHRFLFFFVFFFLRFEPPFHGNALCRLHPCSTPRTQCPFPYRDYINQSHPLEARTVPMDASLLPVDIQRLIFASEDVGDSILLEQTHLRRLLTLRLVCKRYKLSGKFYDESLIQYFQSGGSKWWQKCPSRSWQSLIQLHWL